MAEEADRGHIQETGGFYFYDHYTEAALYCRNIFLHGQYYARLICRLREGETRIPQGEEQLFGLFAGYLELLFQNDLPNPGRHPNDTLHQLCQSLCAGEQPDVARLQMALYPYQWKLSHRFRAVVLHAYREEGWQTHMETTLPFLIRELEHQWRDSCAILLGERTSCISTEPPSAAGWNRSKNSQAFLRFPGIGAGFALVPEAFGTGQRRGRGGVKQAGFSAGDTGYFR